MTPGVSVWFDEAQTGFAALDSDATVEVAIIGAGIGGISAAWHLTRRGLQPLVLEARAIASGATGRSGGFLEAGAADGHTSAISLFGHSRALRIHHATAQARDELLGLAESHAPDAWARRVGSLRVAVNDADLADARAEYDALVADGLGVDWVSQRDLPDPLRRFGIGGLFEPSEALVHPARLVRGLARAVAPQAPVYEQTPVAAPIGERDGGAYVLRANDRWVRAERVIVACDGGLGQLVPSVAPSHVCRRLHIAATAPANGWSVPSGFHWRLGYEYGQQLPDGRVVLGGFSDFDRDAGRREYTLDGAASVDVHARIEHALRADLGVAAPVTHRWTGLVGFARDGQPIVGEVPDLAGVYVLGGYCGSGNLNGWVAGRIVAELICDGASSDADLFAAPVGESGRERLAETGRSA